MDRTLEPGQALPLRGSAESAASNHSLWHPVRTAGLLIAAVFALRGEPAVGAGPKLQLGESAVGFLQRHCTSCHGADEQSAGLRLDQLPASLDGASAATWVRVLDQVTANTMPPADAEQPADADRAAFVTTLRRQLHAASLARQHAEGRVVLRRLNLVEYETTLRDLLGIRISVQDRLPEDAVSAGFDNVSEALQVSPVHLLRYQQVAEEAVRSVVPARRPVRQKIRSTGREIFGNFKTFPASLGKYTRLAGDDLVLYARPYDSVPCGTERVTQPGRYRWRASVTSGGTPGRTLPVMITHHGYGTAESELDRRTRDIPAGQTMTLEEEFELDSREIVVMTPWDLPSPRDLSQTPDALPLENYTGPSLTVHWVEIEGPLDEFPPLGYRQLYGDVPLVNKNPRIPTSVVCSPEQPREDAERLIRRFLPVAFRRPVEEALVEYFVQLAHQQLDQQASFVDAMTVAWTAVFCSPHFLYLVEPLRDGEPAERTQLDDYAIAARLSYFLWSSPPDDELQRLAAAGRLREPAVLAAQVERMLSDPKAARFSRNFAGQWLGLRKINETTPDPNIYREFDDFLYWSMPQETRHFFDEVLTHDLPVTDFLHSDWAFLNERLARHYGIAGIAGGELRKVTLPEDSHRGGVLTQAAILKVTADGTRTSPVLRGTWVLTQLLGTAPPPPPPDIPAIEPDTRGTTTIRQQLDKHRNIEACARCHRHIDPPGFALESFDAIGSWREFYRGGSRERVPLPNYPERIVIKGPDVELGGQTPDGRTFHDIDDYKQLLLADRDQIARNLARKLVIYSTGADIQFADREEIERLVAASRQQGYGFRSLLHSVVQSRLFLWK